MNDTIALVTMLFVGLATLVVHVALALAVNYDANRLETGRVQPLEIGPGIWTLTVLVFGIPALALYWVMYYSTLRR